MENNKKWFSLNLNNKNRSTDQSCQCGSGHGGCHDKKNTAQKMIPSLLNKTSVKVMISARTVLIKYLMSK